MGLLVEKHQDHRGNKVGPWQLLFCYFAGSVQSFPDSAVVKHLSVKQEIWVPSLGQEDPLEKETAIHSSILAWGIPWTEEPGGLQSIGLQKVSHNLATEQKQ